MIKFETMSIAEIKFKKAIAKGELVQYLGGYPEYSIQERFADMPTDYDVAFLPIDNRIKDDPKLQESVLDAIQTLSNDPEYGWGAIFHIGNLAYLKKKQGIDLLEPKFVESVAAALRKNKDAYIAMKKWVGKDLDDGVWDMVRVKNRNLSLDFNITVLPEEL
jgi:hypothetical protein